MEKIGSVILLGILLYGCAFNARMTGFEAGFQLAGAQSSFEQTDSLGLATGLHNGTAAFGNAVCSYGRFLLALVTDSAHSIHANSETLGIVGMLGRVLYAILMFFIFALIGALLHMLFYSGLLFKLFFVAASPMYHLGLLLTVCVTWLVLAMTSVATPPGDDTGGASTPHA